MFCSLCILTVYWFVFVERWDPVLILFSLLSVYVGLVKSIALSVRIRTGETVLLSFFLSFFVYFNGDLNLHSNGIAHKWTVLFFSGRRNKKKLKKPIGCWIRRKIIESNKKKLNTENRVKIKHGKYMVTNWNIQL